jgi:serine/threonine-protein kinase RsbW
MKPTPPPSPNRRTASARPIRLRPELADLAALVGYIDEFADHLHLLGADCQVLTLAAEELFANTLRHCRPPATEIDFSLALGAGFVTGTYSDDAAPFDPTLLPETDPTLPLEERPAGELGIHFIRRTMTLFRYERRGGRNVITFGRPITPPKSSSSLP